MLFISIDIGEKNLGWTIAEVSADISDSLDSLDISDSSTFNLKDFMFHSGDHDYKIKQRDSTVLRRVEAISTFFDSLIGDQKVIGAVIERQVMRNQVAMGLMYAVTMKLAQYTKNIVIFDPKLKFTSIGQQYDTTNKRHKKQSIKNMEKMIDSTELNDISRDELRKTLRDATKKDDIADSFNQLIIQLKLWGKLGDIDLREIYNNYNKDEDE